MAKNKKPITDEIATVEKDIFQDYIGRTLLNPDKVLKSESGGKGIELYEDLLRDDKVGSTLQTRRLAVIGKEWEMRPASEKRQDVKISEYVNDVLADFNYDAARGVLLSGLVMGFKPSEVMWDYSEGAVWIREMIGRASRRFVFDKERRLRLLTLKNMVEGEELPDRKFVVFTNTSDNGSPYGDGLGRMLYWPVWFKKNAIKFWLIFADKFGSPTAVGKYPAGTDKVQQDALLGAIEAIQQEAAIKIPDNMVIELLEATRSGTVNTYEGLCDYMNSAIAQVMLGQTLTSDIGDKGSYSASQTHEGVRQDYIKADADALCLCLNESLIRWIVDYNFPGVTKYPKVWIRTEEEKDLKPLAERDQILLNMGARITHAYIHDTYGIPEPDSNEELLQQQGTIQNEESRMRNTGQQVEGNRQQAEGSKETLEQFAERKSASFLFPDQQAVDDAAASLAPEQLQQQMQGVMKPVIDLIAEGNSYDEIMEALLEAYPYMKTEAIEEMLARAIFVSELWGRLNAGK
jgi:phage gp29-like protein